MPYNLDTIKATLQREYGISIGKPALKLLLEVPMFVPDVGRMIAVSNNVANLPTSTRYGVFKGMVGDEYELEGNRTSLWKHARLLTPAEIAKCF